MIECVTTEMFLPSYQILLYALPDDAGHAQLSRNVLHCVLGKKGQKHRRAKFRSQSLCGTVSQRIGCCRTGHVQFSLAVSEPETERLFAVVNFYSPLEPSCLARSLGPRIGLRFYCPQGEDKHQPQLRPQTTNPAFIHDRYMKKFPFTQTRTPSLCGSSW